jgi:hypothetical protein
MSNITPEQLRTIADLLDESTNAINAYQTENFTNISGIDHIRINNREIEIMLHANRLRVEAIILSVENSAEFIQGINDAIQRIKDTISTIESVEKIINLATSVVALGLSIATSNTDNIKSSIEDIIDILDDDQ